MLNPCRHFPLKPISNNNKNNVKYETVWNTGKAFAEAIVNNTKSSSNQASALRKIGKAIMIANAIIALEDEQ